MIQAIAVDKIRTDGGTQPRAEIDENTVSDYMESIHGGAKFPPLTVFFDGKEYWLADGFHRYHAYLRLKRRSVSADVKQGEQRDAVLFSVGANATHGLRRTNADKRKAALTLLNDSEWSQKSDGWIADQCGVSQTFVSNLRRDLTQNGFESNERLGRDGRAISTANIGAKSSESETDSADDNPYGIRPGDEVVWWGVSTSEMDRGVFVCVDRAIKGDSAPYAVVRVRGGNKITVPLRGLRPSRFEKGGTESDIDLDDEDKPGEEEDNSTSDAEEEDATPDAPLTLEEQIEALPLAQALKLYSHSGHLFMLNAKQWLEDEKFFAQARTRQGQTRFNSGPVFEAYRTVGGIGHPSKWEGCAHCKGSLRVGERNDPCQCKGGFTVHAGEGVSADVVSAYATNQGASDSV